MIFNVASMDLNNYQFLKYIAKKGKPIVLSTGLSSLSEIDKAVSTIEETGNNQLIILHCIAMYPPEDSQVNLNNMDSLSSLYPYPVGFSDHSLGVPITFAATAKGACLIEKHYTLDKNMFGWDHKVSADSQEMNIITDGVRRIFDSLGSTRILPVENDERVETFRRSIVASREIKKGEVFVHDMIDFKRPGSGLSPEEEKYLIGKRAKKNIGYDDIIDINDF